LCRPALVADSEYTVMKPSPVIATTRGSSRGVAFGAQRCAASERPPKAITKTRKVTPTWTSMPASLAKLTRVTPKDARAEAVTMLASSAFRVMSVQRFDDDHRDVVQPSCGVGQLDEPPRRLLDALSLEDFGDLGDRKSTRLNSSHVKISY